MAYPSWESFRLQTRRPVGFLGNLVNLAVQLRTRMDDIADASGPHVDDASDALGTGERLSAGIGSDLLLYHDGTNSYITSATGVLTIDQKASAVLEIQAAGIINIGSDADAFDINVGTGAAARDITVGNVTGATALSLVSGTGGATYQRVTGGSEVDLAGRFFATNQASAATPNPSTTSEVVYSTLAASECQFVANELTNDAGDGDGTAVRYTGVVTCSNNNANDTLTIRVRLGGGGGDIIFETTGADVATNEFGVISGGFVVRGMNSIYHWGDVQGTLGAGAADDMEATGNSFGTAAPDTSSALDLVVTYEWSVSHNDNDSELQSFVVELA